MEASESKVLALVVTEAGGERLQQIVATAPEARLEGLISSLEDFERKALQLQPEIMLIEYVPNRAGLDDLIKRLRRSVIRGAVVVVANSREPEDILRAMRLGVQEYLTEPMPSQAFNEALLRLRVQSQAAAEEADMLLAVMGVKGGVGTSHLAVNLAWALSQKFGQRVALVDLDLRGGDVAALMDLKPPSDLSDVARNYDRLDALLMESLLVEAAPGLSLLAAPTDPVALEEINGEHVGRALDYLRAVHSVVVTDLTSRLSESNLAALDRCTRLLLVMEPTVICLNAAHRIFSLLPQLGFDRAKLIPIVNRYDVKGGLNQREIGRVLNQNGTAWLPNEDSLIIEASNAGRPIVADFPRCNWSKKVKHLAGTLLDDLGEAK